MRKITINSNKYENQVNTKIYFNNKGITQNILSQYKIKILINIGNIISKKK